MKKLAIIGASQFQVPLILKAKEMGLETHVFAWECGDEGESLADFFYPISIREKESILDVCKKINIDGICTIGSDLATIAVNYVANQMGLVGNSLRCTELSTNKYLMRKCFEKNGDPSPKSVLISDKSEIESLKIAYPVICKPTDRSGSRGIFKVNNKAELINALEKSMEQSFEHKALVEEFAEGQEYSVEYISENGDHHFLAVTKKYTTGAPHYIETGHLQPAPISDETLKKIKSVTEHALSSLEVTNGASHTELKIDDSGNIKIIEIGARMGGDFIGSDLVPLSTGYDFVQGVIDVAMGNCGTIIKKGIQYAAVKFLCEYEDFQFFKKIYDEKLIDVIRYNANSNKNIEVNDSSSRLGYYIFVNDRFENLEKVLLRKRT